MSCWLNSRTGVTEMGGICAYQLADAIVVLCAPNQQNMQGTHDVVRNFFSPRVRMLRSGRELRLVVVPARVELRDDRLLEVFRGRFEERFKPFEPPALSKAGLGFWDLLIPYEAEYAFDERVLDAPKTAVPSRMRPAFGRLVQAIGSLADPDDPLRRLIGRERTPDEAPKPLYDPVSRSAGYDVYLSYQRGDRQPVQDIASALASRGLLVCYDEPDFKRAGDLVDTTQQHLDQSCACALFVGPSGEYPWRAERFRAALELRSQGGDFRIIPVLLPGATVPSVEDLPPYLSGLPWLSINDIGDEQDIARLGTHNSCAPGGSARIGNGR